MRQSTLAQSNTRVLSCSQSKQRDNVTHCLGWAVRVAYSRACAVAVYWQQSFPVSRTVSVAAGCRGTTSRSECDGF